MPLSGYGIDLWQADAEGNYPPAEPDYWLRGRRITDSAGRFAFETIKPGNYRIASGPRPAHIHFRVYDPAGAVVLTSQLYFEGDPYLGDADSCPPPTCFSNDDARIVRLEPATVGGREGQIAMLPVFIARSE
jgi:protocatechuate 3,4-dioxygenase beta subunit